MTQPNNKLQQEKASFFIKLIHELRTPIHGISGVSSYLIQNWDQLNSITKKKCVNDLATASNVLNELIEYLAQTVKQTNNNIRFNFQQTDILSEIKIAINIANLLLFSKNITIEIESKLTQCIAYIDIFWFKQLITNILANAINYSEQGIIKISVEHNTTHYVISIIDEGIGIPKDEIENIFQEFNQGSQGSSTHVKSYNLGLGLAICKEIVEAHHGKILASNNQEKGARIEFTIPILK